MSNSADDLLKDWDERREKAAALYTEFKEQYQDVPGVISIKDDDWFGDTFMIMYDNKLLDLDAIPANYKGILIQFYDVYQTRDSFQQLHNHLKDAYPEADQDLFSTNLKYLNDIIAEYEARK